VARTLLVTMKLTILLCIKLAVLGWPAGIVTEILALTDGGRILQSLKHIEWSRALCIVIISICRGQL
jgi:hypothetical protein